MPVVSKGLFDRGGGLSMIDLSCSNDVEVDTAGQIVGHVVVPVVLVSALS